MTKKKICVVSSCGGHLAEVRLLRPVFEQHDHFYVLNDRVLLPKDMEGKTYFVTLFERDLGGFVANLREAWSILRKERPQMILSAGAGVLVPFALCAKLLGIRVLFIETLNRVHHPSLTARIMYRLADRFFYQWESLRPYFPKGQCCGPIY